MPRLSTIELFKEDMKFNAGHFAIFSPTHRENLHGHNYTVHFYCTTIIEDEGMSFDYRFYKNKISQLCEELDEVVLMPGKCRYLSIEEAGDYYHVHFNQEKIIFLKRDLKVIPVTNITVEELSNYLLNKILEDKDELNMNRVQSMELKVFSGPGQSGSASWSLTDE